MAEELPGALAARWSRRWVRRSVDGQRRHANGAAATPPALSADGRNAHSFNNKTLKTKLDASSRSRARRAPAQRGLSTSLQKSRTRRYGAPPRTAAARHRTVAAALETLPAAPADPLAAASLDDLDAARASPAVEAAADGWWSDLLAAQRGAAALGLAPARALVHSLGEPAGGAKQALLGRDTWLRCFPAVFGRLAAQAGVDLSPLLLARMAAEEWVAHSPSRLYMTKPQLVDAAFTIASVWCRGADPPLLAAFLHRARVHVGASLTGVLSEEHHAAAAAHAHQLAAAEAARVVAQEDLGSPRGYGVATIPSKLSAASPSTVDESAHAEAAAAEVQPLEVVPTAAAADGLLRPRPRPPLLAQGTATLRSWRMKRRTSTVAARAGRERAPRALAKRREDVELVVTPWALKHVPLLQASPGAHFGGANGPLRDVLCDAWLSPRTRRTARATTASIESAHMAASTASTKRRGGGDAAVPAPPQREGDGRGHLASTPRYRLQGRADPATSTADEGDDGAPPRPASPPGDAAAAAAVVSQLAALRLADGTLPRADSFSGATYARVAQSGEPAVDGDPPTGRRFAEELAAADAAAQARRAGTGAVSTHAPFQPLQQRARATHSGVAMLAAERGSPAASPAASSSASPDRTGGALGFNGRSASTGGADASTPRSAAAQFLTQGLSLMLREEHGGGQQQQGQQPAEAPRPPPLVLARLNRAETTGADAGVTPARASAPTAPGQRVAAGSAGGSGTTDGDTEGAGAQGVAAESAEVQGVDARTRAVVASRRGDGAYAALRRGVAPREWMGPLASPAPPQELASPRWSPRVF